MRPTVVDLAAGKGVRRTDDVTPLSALLHDVRAFLLTYVVMSSEAAIAIVLWIVHTHTIEAASTTPYLSIWSAAKRCGKTLLLEVLEALVNAPWLTGRTSAAALVRKIDRDHPTLLLDESDAAFSGEKDYAEALRGILNSGYKASGKASVCVGQGTNITVRDFAVFSAKALAGIGTLPDTIQDRAIPIVLKRRLKAETTARWRRREVMPAAEYLRDRIAGVAATIVPVLQAAVPPLPEQLHDRAADVWEPLFAIADAAGGEWPMKARGAALTLMGDASDDDDRLVQLLTDVRPILVALADTFDSSGKPTTEVASATLVEKLVSLDDRPWKHMGRGEKGLTQHGLAKLLAPVGIRPGQIGPRHEGRGYQLAAFADPIARFLPLQVSKCPNPNNDGPKSVDSCDPADGSKNASVQQFDPDSIDVWTLGHLEPPDAGDRAPTVETAESGTDPDPGDDPDGHDY